MSSAAGSALTPISRTVVPLSVTRPSAISFSAARLEATPACDRIFCRRRTPELLFTLPCSHFSVRVPGSVHVLSGTDGKCELLRQYVRPKADELPCIHRAGVGVDAGVRDQSAEQ